MTTATLKTPRNAVHAFREVKEHAEKIKSGEPQVVGTMSPGDTQRQGDVYIVCLGPKNSGVLAQLGNLTPIAERQLAPGETQGSRHILEGDVRLFRATEPGKVAAVINGLVKGAAVQEALIGPVFETGAKTELTHPEHGNFKYPEGEICATVYQRAHADEVRRQVD